VFDNEIDAKRLLRELRILRMLRNHEAIVDMVDLLPPTDPNTFNTIILVFEFVDTDLSKLIQSDQYFTTLHVQYMLYQIMLGLKYMHSGNVAHRDLKPANILVNEDCTLKICDFGLARGITENVEQPKPFSEEHLDEPKDKKSRNTKNKKKTKERIDSTCSNTVVSCT
jgi:mitogen-activated protein kinase 1/3